MFRCVQTGFENDTVFTVAAGVEVRGNKEPEMRRYAIISVNLSGSGLGFEGWGELVWGCKAEESSQRQDRETQGLEPHEPKSPKQGHSSCYCLLMEWGYFSSID